jgi:hypothetical protein
MSIWKTPARLLLSLCGIALSYGCTSSGSPVIPGLRAAPPASAGAGSSALRDASAQSSGSGMMGTGFGALAQNGSAAGSAAVSGVAGTAGAGAADAGSMDAATAAAGSSAGVAGHAGAAGAAGGSAGESASQLDAAADSGGVSQGDGDAGMCQNLVCLSIFDCLFYHPAQYVPCKITRCDNFVCKP